MLVVSNCEEVYLARGSGYHFYPYNVYAVEIAYD